MSKYICRENCHEKDTDGQTEEWTDGHHDYYTQPNVPHMKIIWFVIVTHNYHMNQAPYNYHVAHLAVLPSILKAGV